MTRAYATLLRLYPPEYRALFAAEMLAVFKEAAEEQHAGGGLAYLRFAALELIGLLIGAAVEWVEKILRPASYSESGCTRAQTQSTLPQEVMEAQARVNLSVNRMVHAIANHQFEKVRFYSSEEYKARENLRVLREKYNISE
jgi:hypothetical protein